MPKARKAGLDAATEQQAIASAQWLIKIRGGHSHKYSQEYWRFSTKAELRGEPLAHYAGTCLVPPPGRKKARQQPNSSKPQSHKTDYRDWILALTVDDIVRHFKLKHTRNDATEEPCGSSIVATATELHENTVQNA